MPTTNVSVTTSWTKIANAGESFLLSGSDPVEIEVATTSADAAPTVSGHLMDIRYNALMRDVIGAGYVWAKVIKYGSSVTLVVTK